MSLQQNRPNLIGGRYSERNRNQTFVVLSCRDVVVSASCRCRANQWEDGPSKSARTVLFLALAVVDRVWRDIHENNNGFVYNCFYILTKIVLTFWIRDEHLCTFFMMCAMTLRDSVRAVESFAWSLKFTKSDFQCISKPS